MTNNKAIKILYVFVLVISVMMCTFILQAEEHLEDSGIEMYSLGDNGETILVRGRDNTVGDYGDVIGYEITSASGSGYIDYRDSAHHSMWVSTNQGETEGYCMQPYVNGPGTNAYTDYNYKEGLDNSTIFSTLSTEESNKWITEYVVSTKHGFGGSKADPNQVGGSNIHDGGTYGTYVIFRDGQLKSVRGLMIGGKVYEMTEEETRALTQVIVHYVGNRGSQYNITDFKGYKFPSETSAAFAHLKAYADNAGINYDNAKSIRDVSIMYDEYKDTKAYQSIKWYIYDYHSNNWTEYDGQTMNEDNISQDNKIKLRIDYFSKNICNKLLNNSSNNLVSVKYNYSPFVVSSISNEERHYDYISVTNSSSIPVQVTYEAIESGKEDINNALLDNLEYEIDTFSQTAFVEIDFDDLINSGRDMSLSVGTGVGSTAADCYDFDAGKYGTRLYSSATIQDCLILASNKDVMISSDIVLEFDMTGSISLKKISERPEITDDNSCYNMSGATYAVYAVESDKDDNKSNMVGKFVVNESGSGVVTYSKYNKEDVSVDGSEESKNKLTKLPLGWYMISEESPPSNGSYKLDDKKYYILIDSNNYKLENIVESKEAPVADPIPFEIVKQSAEGQNVGAATLEGAEFTVYYYKGEYESIEEIKEMEVEADRRWIFSTEIATTTNNATCIIHQDLLVEGSDVPYLNDDGDMILPLGTIVVEETKAPVGYQLQGASYYILNTIDGTKEPIEGPFICLIQENQGTVKLSVENKILVEEEPIRGDIKLVKKDKHTGNPMEGIPFLITSDTTGESHIIVTNKDGIASTENSFISHSDRTNGNDEYDDKQNLIPTGVWFTGNISEGMVDDAKGALPYDTYTIREMYCEENKDYYLSEEFKISIQEPNIVYEYGEINNVHKPVIKTEAFDAIDEDKVIAVGGRVSVVDKVNYEYLEIGKSYVLKGTMINKSTEEKVLSEGKEVISYVEFTPAKESGVVEVPFEFELVCCKGDKLVVYQYLYEKDSGELVAVHEDIQCENQTLTLETTGVKNEVINPEEEMATEITPTTGDKHDPRRIILVMILSGVLILGIVCRSDQRSSMKE